MALEVVWTIEIGDLATPVDFSDRTAGLQISQKLGFMQPAAHRCTITLNNFDGALTPGAGGTYSATDWFSQGLFISATVNGTDTARVFEGIVNDFDIEDDGVTSRVTLVAVDWMTIGARGIYPFSATVATDSEWATRVAASINTFCTSVGFIALPRLGTNFAAPMFYYNGGAPFTPSDTGEVAAGTVILGTRREANETMSDVLTTRELAGVPSVVWPTVIEPETESGQPAAKYMHQLVGDTLSRNADQQTFTFTEGTPAAGEFPLGEVDRGYNVERVINAARITSAFTAATKSKVLQDEINKIGAKQLVATQSSMNNDGDTERMANNLVNRFSQARFQAREISVNSAQWAETDAGSKDELAKLLDVRYGLWQVAVVKYTPTGASSQQTDDTVIFGRTIRATPAQTTITLELLPAQDYQSFVLDSSTLGVLDQNRLG